LTHDLNVIYFIYSYNDYWQVAGNAAGPQSGTIQSASAQQVRRRTLIRVREQYRVRQPLEQMSFFDSDTQVMELDLRLSPSKR
jgi:hypothetical protein